MKNINTHRFEFDLKMQDTANGFAITFSDSDYQFQIVASSKFKAGFINNNGTISKRFRQ